LTSEHPVNHRSRKFGKTKYGGSRFLHGFFDLLTVLFLGKYFQRPLHFFGVFGLINLIIGISINIYLTIGWINNQAIGNRPILFLGILLIIIGIQFISLGLLGELVIKSNSKSENRVSSIYSLKNINENNSN
jgi:dolichol-phosphate mannosyltransferase